MSEARTTCPNPPPRGSAASQIEHALAFRPGALVVLSARAGGGMMILVARWWKTPLAWRCGGWLRQRLAMALVLTRKGSGRRIALRELSGC
jgi:hypothetical protein